MNGKIVVLDVREDLKNKLEPFQKIMTTVKTLEKSDIFVLHSTIKPTPLMTLLKTRGYENLVEKRADDHFITTFKKKKRSLLFWKNKHENIDRPNCPQQDIPSVGQDDTNSYYLDNRGLEPPQPMVRTLARLTSMKNGEVLTIRNDRLPAFLIEELNQLGYEYKPIEMEDGSVEVVITKNGG
ncbi:DUF2249 domain-containing protein [Anaerobacillus alkaliphilus]|uniref:DUF2249 domain-containing protein n=1 Tax=Anaerobacillus alkaliphilus TaxID=1548597 RepID=A0A4V1LG25_9BACI|nr:DUF2249 domain-containing protein [Anaerobacillus alkaliphilus]RXI98284.1 DUF2249 domain-containing protein [Anaerobacillus alkaliphilus]